MEKLKITPRFWGLIGCLFFSLQLLGQTTTPPTSLVILDDQDKGGGGAYQTVGATGIGEIEISIKVANLVPADQAMPEVSYFIPSPQYPRMGLHYDIAGDQGIIAVNNFHFTNIIINGHAIFEAEVTVQYNLQDECNAPNENNGIFYINGVFTVVEYLSGNPYSVAAYSGSSEIFSCEAFYNTCGYCNQTCPVPDQILQMTRTESWFCDLTFPPDGSDGSSGQHGLEQNSNGKSTMDISLLSQNSPNQSEGSTVLDPQTLKVAPNPFRNTTQLEYTLKKAEKIQIRVLDNTGKLVSQWTEDTPAGTFSKEINLAELPEGIYYGQIITEQEALSFRLVKLNP